MEQQQNVYNNETANELIFVFAICVERWTYSRISLFQFCQLMRRHIRLSCEWIDIAYACDEATFSSIGQDQNVALGDKFHTIFVQWRCHSNEIGSLSLVTGLFRIRAHCMVLAVLAIIDNNCIELEYFCSFKSIDDSAEADVTIKVTEGGRNN